MLTALAIGDAYGAAFEFADPAFIEANNTVTRYNLHPTHRQRQPGEYTDDTQMSIAVAELVLEETVWTPEVIADKFLACYQRDKRPGYNEGFRYLLGVCKTGPELLVRLNGDSKKSGAAMRASACGIFPSHYDVLAYAKLQASVTHKSKEGVEAAQAVALACHYFMYQIGTKEGLRAYLLNKLSDAFWLRRPWRMDLVPAGIGTNIVNAAITVIERQNNLQDILQKTVSLEGDTDTVAAIALAIASDINTGMKRNLPMWMISGLERGTYGSQFLMQLDGKLYDKRQELSKGAKIS